MLLDTASNGNFLGKDVNEGMTLVENLALSDGQYGEDFDRSSRGGSDFEDKTRKDMKSLNEKLDKILLASQRTVNFVGNLEGPQGYEEDVANGLDGQEVINYVGGQGNYQGGYNKGFNSNYRNHPNFSWRSTNVENPYDQVLPPPQKAPFQANQAKPFQPSPQAQGGISQGQGYDPRNQFQGNQGNYPTKPSFAPQSSSQQVQPSSTSTEDQELKNMLQTVLQGQVKGAHDLSKKMTDFNNKLDSSYNDLNSKIETLSTKVKHMEGKSASTSHGKDACHTISPNEEQDAIIEEFLDLYSCPDDEEPLNEDIETLGGGVPLENDKQTSLEGTTSDVHEEPLEDEPPLPLGIDNQISLKEEVAKGTHEEPLEIEEPYVAPPPYEPPLPFPRRFLTKAQERVLTCFKGKLDKIGVPMPSESHLAQLPHHLKFINDILKNREEVEALMATLALPSSPKVTPTSLPKLGNPGKFSIYCKLGDLEIDDALCDSGSSVSVMSLAMATKLGIDNLKDYPSILTFGDSSSKKSLGVIEDYPVKVGNCIVPTDFIVMEMEPTKKLPLLLGTSFLNTVGASLDFINKKVVLKNVNDQFFYTMMPSSLGICGTITYEECGVQAPRVEYAGSCATMAMDNEEEPLALDGVSLISLFKTSKDYDMKNGRNAKEKNKAKAIVKDEPKAIAKEECLLDQPPIITLTPWKHEKGVIEYKLKCPGRSKPFSTVKAILTQELKDKGQAGLEEIMDKVLKLELMDKPRNPTTPPPLH